MEPRFIRVCMVMVMLLWDHEQSEEHFHPSLIIISGLSKSLVLLRSVLKTRTSCVFHHVESLLSNRSDCGWEERTELKLLPRCDSGGIWVWCWVSRKVVRGAKRRNSLNTFNSSQISFWSKSLTFWNKRRYWSDYFEHLHDKNPVWVYYGFKRELSITVVISVCFVFSVISLRPPFCDCRCCCCHGYTES